MEAKFTKDIYEKLRPGTPEKQLVLIGRIATSIVVLLGILWIPIITRLSGQLYEYLQNVQAYIAPPIAAVFLMGVFSKRVNSRSAIMVLVGGFLLGMLKLTLGLFVDSLGGFLHFYATFNFLYFCISLFVICMISLYVISMLSEKPAAEKIENLTFGSANIKEMPDAMYSKWDIINTVIVLALVLAVFTYFTG